MTDPEPLRRSDLTRLEMEAPVHGLVIRKDFVSCLCRAVMPDVEKGGRPVYEPFPGEMPRDYPAIVRVYNKPEHHNAPLEDADYIGRKRAGY